MDDSGGRPFAPMADDEPKSLVTMLGCERGMYGFGLSLPVGPLPSAGRFAGGRLSAARSVLFSSSSSATRFSRACEKVNGSARAVRRTGHVGAGGGRTSRCAARRALNALWTSLARLGGRLSFLFLPRFEDIASDGSGECANVTGGGGGWGCRGRGGRRGGQQRMRGGGGGGRKEGRV